MLIDLCPLILILKVSLWDLRDGGLFIIVEINKGATMLEENRFLLYNHCEEFFNYYKLLLARICRNRILLGNILL